MNFEKELEDILTTDPLDLLKPKHTNPVITDDDRLRDSFLEINNFFEKEKREPEESADINERRLYVRLKEMKKDPDKILFLKEFDTNNLLGEAKEINSVNDIMEDDYLGILEEEDDVEDIFEITHFSKPRDKADFVARRTPCKDFAIYEEQFKQIIKKASKAGIAIEVNSFYHPNPWNLIHLCEEEGAYISLGSNAHDVSNVGNIIKILKETN